MLITVAKKLLTYILIILVAVLLASLFGALHDQLTYTISQEYYTKFKFIQFGLEDVMYKDDSFSYRMGAVFVGVFSTWWVGLIIGVILGIIGVVLFDVRNAIKNVWLAMMITLVIAFMTGLIGLAYGWFYLSVNGVNWQLPENLLYTKNFIAAGSMHNFSYIGGALGLTLGVVYLFRKRKKVLR